jgi:hypothetical protein
MPDAAEMPILLRNKDMQALYWIMDDKEREEEVSLTARTEGYEDEAQVWR